MDYAINHIISYYLELFKRKFAGNVFKHILIEKI